MHLDRRARRHRNQQDVLGHRAGVHEELGVDPDIVYVSGGAIAVGHPIGMSGARITLHAALELARQGSGYAVAALCGAGGTATR